MPSQPSAGVLRHRHAGLVERNARMRQPTQFDRRSFCNLSVAAKLNEHFNRKRSHEHGLWHHRNCLSACRCMTAFRLVTGLRATCRFRCRNWRARRDRFSDLHVCVGGNGPGIWTPTEGGEGMPRQRVLAPPAWFVRHGRVQHDIHIVPPLVGLARIEPPIGHRSACLVCSVCLVGIVRDRSAS